MPYLFSVLCFALFFLAGCQNPQSTDYRSCLLPTTTIIHDLSRHSFFDDVSYHEIARLEIESLKEFSQKNEAEAELSFQIIFSGLRNAAQPKLQGTYFIAIMDQRDTPLLKKRFPLEIIFEGNRKYQRKITEVTLPVPLALVDHCENYKIFIGFDLKGEDLERGLHRLVKNGS